MNRYALVITMALGGASVETYPSETYVCPPKVQLSSGKISEKFVSPSFTAMVSESPIWLTGASAFDGPPEEGASIKPDRTRKIGKTETSIWVFHGVLDRGKWVTCDYSDGLVRLAAQVNDRSLKCSAAAERRHNPDMLSIAISCD